MKNIQHLLYILCLLITTPGYCQVGGRHVYDFLNLSTGPFITALGGVNVSIWEDDLHLAFQNPALLTDSMDNLLALSYTDYLADIGFGFAGYSKTISGLGSFYSGIQFVDYGELQEADALGNKLGTFSAGELAWALGYSRAVGRFRYGVQTKLIYSKLAPDFQSFGLAADLGAAFQGKERLFSAGLVVRNVGAQLTTYSGEGIRENLPFQVILGISNRLRYVPFRLSITAIHLEQPQLVYDDPDAPVELDLNGNEIDNSPGFADKLFRHLIFGGEFLLGKALRLRMGYNHLRRQELRSQNRGGTTGFTFGAGIFLKRVKIDYGFGSYGLNGLFHTHQFGMAINFNPLK